MKGIQIHGGALFVEHEGVTVRVRANGQCEVSPVLYMVLEWDLRTEPPDRWDYVTESDIRAMDNDVYGQILAIVSKVRSRRGQ